MWVGSRPDIRCWYIDLNKTHLLQVQADRFILNWRKIKGDEAYPTYEHNRPKFEENWRMFCDFLLTEQIAPPEVNQCEVTYVNHIEIGRGWETYGDVHKVIRCLSDTADNLILPKPEKVRLNTFYVIPGDKGRLRIMLQPAVRRRDAKEVLQLTLTARGKPASSALEDLLAWFDLGHEWIVKGFTDFTTPLMHELWGRQI